jgi:hypothetical protein
MVWLGIFVAESSFQSRNLSFLARGDCLLFLACVMVAPILGLLGVQKRDIMCVRFNAGFNCIGGCLAFTLCVVVLASLKYAEEFYEQCEDATQPDIKCARLSDETKSNLRGIHTHQKYVWHLVLPMCLFLGVLACTSALVGRRLASHLQATVYVRTPLISEHNQTSIQPQRRLI